MAHPRARFLIAVIPCILAAPRGLPAQIAPTLAATWGGSGTDWLGGARIDPLTGNYVAVGATESFGRSRDFLLVQFTPAGATILPVVTWGSAGVDELNDVAVAGTGPTAGIYAAGWTDGYQTHAQDLDILVVKFPWGPSAPAPWAVTWTGNGGTAEHADGAFSAPSGDVYLVGGMETPNGTEDVLLLRFTPPASGPPTTTLAQARWGHPNDSESLNGVTVDQSAGAVHVSVTGTRYTAAGGQDILVQQYDANLNLRWAHTWGGVGLADAWSIVSDAAGNLHVIGQYQAAVGAPSDALVMKWSHSGTLLWTAILGGPGDESLGGIAFDCVGNLLLTGQANPTATPGQEVGLFFKLDADGNLLWAQTCQAAGAQRIGLLGQPTVPDCADVLVTGDGTGAAGAMLVPWTPPTFARSTSTALVGTPNPMPAVDHTITGQFVPRTAAPAANPGTAAGRDGWLLRYPGATTSFLPACPARPTSAGGPVLDFTTNASLGQPLGIRRTSASPAPLTALLLGVPLAPLPLQPYGGTVPGAAICISPLVVEFRLGTSPTLVSMPIPFDPGFCGVTFDAQWIDLPELGNSAVGRFRIGL
jgi:hypothetical protein